MFAAGLAFVSNADELASFSFFLSAKSSSLLSLKVANLASSERTASVMLPRASTLSYSGFASAFGAAGASMPITAFSFASML